MKKIKKQYNLLFVATVSLYLITLFIYGLWDYIYLSNEMFRQVDSKLYNSAVALKYIIPDDLHDRAVDSNAITLEEDMEIVQKLNSFVKDANFKYVYTLIKKDGKLFFIAGNNDDCETERGTYYFLEYKEADDAFYEAFNSSKPIFKSVSDRWGDFRTAIIPQISPKGTKYLLCADYDLSYIKGLLRENLVRSITIAAFFLFLGVPIIILYIKMRSRYFKQLQESEAKYRAIVESTSDWIWEIDSDARFTYVSPTVKKILGYEPEEILGKSAFDLMSADEADKVAGVYDPAREKQEPFHGMRNINIHKDGHEVVLDSSGVPIFDENGRFFGYRGVDRDVSEMVKIEETRRHTQKMDAIGQLAGGVAHDFNNMLVAIMGNAELLKPSLTDESQKELISSIFEASKRARDLTNKLLSFSRKGQIVMKSFDMHECINNAMSLLERSIDKRIKINKKLVAADSVVKGDSTQMQNCILNMGLNARDAMPDGGIINVSTSNVIFSKADFRAQEFEILPGNYLKIDIADTGIGMDKKTQERIFEPFFSTKGIGKGTGLGLASAYGAVIEQNGIIRVESELGKGSLFSIYLPIFDDVMNLQEDMINKDILKGEGKILIVDDERLVGLTTSNLLGKMGYDVDLVEHGDKAIAVYKAKNKEIDLILLDLIMPEKNGYDTFFELKEINPDVKVILCSGFSKDTNVNELLKKGARDFIQKPFQAHELSQKIAEVIKS